MTHDVGHVLRQAVGSWISRPGSRYNGGLQPVFTSPGGPAGYGPRPPPGYDTEAPPGYERDAAGNLCKKRRRRRRRLLTPTDLNDLAALKTIVGGGQAINFAVMKAVRR